MNPADELDDSEFLNAFETCRLDKAAFNHRGHVRLAWLCLRAEDDLPRAAFRCANAIRRFAEHHGAHDKFHMTLTLAFMHLLHQRFRRDEDFVTFYARNPELFTDARTLIEAHYSAGLLADGTARRSFVPPDRAPLP